MQTYLLVIKGRSQDARFACMSRGIAATFVWVATGAREECRMLCAAPTSTIVNWYGEDPQGAPFPIGALLFFSSNSPAKYY